MHQPVDPTVKFIRMNTGEDIITEIVQCKHNEEEYYTLINPLKVIYFIKDSSLVISLSEWVFPKLVNKMEFNIYPSDVITMQDVSEAMNVYYHNFLTNKVLEQETEQMVKPEDIPDEEVELIQRMINEAVTNHKRKLN